MRPTLLVDLKTIKNLVRFVQFVLFLPLVRFCLLFLLDLAPHLSPLYLLDLGVLVGQELAEIKV